MSDFEIILQKAGREEILAQLAEECTELAQAALKYRRALMAGKNPTPVKPYQALWQLQEEMADVDVCVRALGLSFLDEYVLGVSADKRARWRERLEEAEK